MSIYPDSRGLPTCDIARMWTAGHTVGGRLGELLELLEITAQPYSKQCDYLPCMARCEHTNPQFLPWASIFSDSQEGFLGTRSLTQLDTDIYIVGYE